MIVDSSAIATVLNFGFAGSMFALGFALGVIFLGLGLRFGPGGE